MAGLQPERQRQPWQVATLLSATTELEPVILGVQWKAHGILAVVMAIVEAQ